MVDSGLGMADAGHVGHGEISVSRVASYRAIFDELEV